MADSFILHTFARFCKTQLQAPQISLIQKNEKDLSSLYHETFPGSTLFTQFEANSNEILCYEYILARFDNPSLFHCIFKTVGSQGRRQCITREWKPSRIIETQELQSLLSEATILACVNYENRINLDWTGREHNLLFECIKNRNTYVPRIIFDGSANEAAFIAKLLFGNRAYTACTLITSCISTETIHNILKTDIIISRQKEAFHIWCCKNENVCTIYPLDVQKKVFSNRTSDNLGSIINSLIGANYIIAVGELKKGEISFPKDDLNGRDDILFEKRLQRLHACVLLSRFIRQHIIFYDATTFYHYAIAAHACNSKIDRLYDQILCKVMGFQNHQFEMIRGQQAVNTLTEAFYSEEDSAPFLFDIEGSVHCGPYILSRGYVFKNRWFQYHPNGYVRTADILHMTINLQDPNILDKVIVIRLLQKEKNEKNVSSELRNRIVQTLKQLNNHVFTDDLELALDIESVALFIHGYVRDKWTMSDELFESYIKMCIVLKWNLIASFRTETSTPYNENCNKNTSAPKIPLWLRYMAVQYGKNEYDVTNSTMNTFELPAATYTYVMPSILTSIATLSHLNAPIKMLTQKEILPSIGELFHQLSSRCYTVFMLLINPCRYNLYNVEDGIWKKIVHCNMNPKNNEKEFVVHSCKQNEIIDALKDCVFLFYQFK